MHRILLICLIALPAFLGCGQKARYVETGGPESVVRVGQVDIQDLQRAASGMLESLLREGVLRRAPHQPARIHTENVVNDTTSRFDVGELTYRMREQLVNSGQAVEVTAYGAAPESRAAQEELRRQAFLQGRTEVESLTPDFILTGKITQLRASAGDVRQATYTFRLTLTDARTGLEAWTKVVDITKQGTRPSVGF